MIAFHRASINIVLIDIHIKSYSLGPENWLAFTICQNLSISNYYCPLLSYGLVIPYNIGRKQVKNDGENLALKSKWRVLWVIGEAKISICVQILPVYVVSVYSLSQSNPSTPCLLPLPIFHVEMINILLIQN